MNDESEKVVTMENNNAENNTSEEITDEEDELPPPEEENDASEVDVGNIMGLFIIIILIIFLIVFVSVNISGKKKKNKSSDELDKAGTKTVIEFKEKKEAGSGADIEEAFSVEKSEGEIDEALEQLPVELRLPEQSVPGTAPVVSVGKGNSKTERPDTRNSKSPRKIEGLAAMNYSGQEKNQDTVKQLSYNNYGSDMTGQKISREDFISQQMTQTQNLQNMLYGNGLLSDTESEVYDNKENFYTSSVNTAGNGSYLEKSALWDGTIISGALITAINTDNPGVVIARVTENVYSSQDHSYLLIPEGSLLMATYNSSVSYGQNKVQVAWNLLIRPDNYRVQLGNMNGVGSQGESGYKGFVNNHPFETLKALGLVAIYSIVQTEVSNDINSQNNEYLQNAMTDVYSEASKIGNKIVERALDIKPTITIKEGTEIKLITNVPLVLPPVEMNRASEKYIRTKK